MTETKIFEKLISTINVIKNPHEHVYYKKNLNYDKIPKTDKNNSRTRSKYQPRNMYLRSKVKTPYIEKK